MPSGTVRVGAHDDDMHDRTRRIAWLDFAAIERAKVLVVGAGAIGNETLKNLALAGYRNITIVDMDHIVKSNLSRCVLFTEMDAGERRLKAEVHKVIPNPNDLRMVEVWVKVTAPGTFPIRLTVSPAGRQKR